MRTATHILFFLGTAVGVQSAVAQQVAPVEEEAPAETGDVLRRTLDANGDPYAPLGLRSGSFLLFPTIETSVRVTRNSAAASLTASARVAAALTARSDWARHQATLAMRGSYRRTFDGVTADDPAGSVDGTLRLDLADQWNANLAGGYGYSQQVVTDPNFPAGLDGPPGVHVMNVRGTLNGGAGRLRMSLTGSLVRTFYEDGTSGGLPVDQGDRINNLGSATARLGYQLTGSLTPFVEGEITRRQYDRVVDTNGLRRSTTEIGYRAGLRIDRGPVLSGELAVGMQRAVVDDAALSDITALAVGGSLAWTPTPLTTVTFNAATFIAPTTDVASSGSLTREGSVAVAYAWRPNFTWNWRAGFGHEAFQGTGREDWRARAGVEAVWRLNRSVHVTASYNHERQMSTDPGSNYTEDSIRLGLRMQR